MVALRVAAVAGLVLAWTLLPARTPTDIGVTASPSRSAEPSTPPPSVPVGEAILATSLSRPPLDVGASAVNAVLKGAGWEALGQPARPVRLLASTALGPAVPRAEVVPAEQIADALAADPHAVAAITLDELDARMRAVRVDGVHPAEADAVSMAAVGDISFSRFVNTVIRREGDWSYPLREVASVLRDFDITVGNLESSVSSRFDVPASGTSFVSDPRALRGLKLAGFDAVSLANNHATNFGLRAFRDTLTELRDAGVGWFGGGRDEAAAHAALDMRVGDERIAFLGYNAIIGSVEARGDSPGIAYIHGAPFSSLDRGELATAVADVEREDAEGKFVIVFMHWGAEYTYTPNGDQVRTARALIRAGADLVIGAHPHWVQGLEFYRGKLIAYSLGNFVFDQTFERQTKQGMAFTGLIRKGRLVAFDLLPLRIAGGAQPRFVAKDSKQGRQILADVVKASRTEELRAAVYD